MNLKFLVSVSLISCLLIFTWLFSSLKEDPYVQASLRLKGSEDKGAQLFRMNCVGCHGISAQGLLGPDLQNVTTEITDKEIINQVVKGLTPPMPSFEMEAQSMSDLIAYLHSLN